MHRGDESEDNLIADLIFPTVVWRKHLTYDNSRLAQYITELKSSTNGKAISNVGGWQSLDSLRFPDKFNELQTQISESIKQICIETNLPPLTLDNLWYNINTPGSYNMIHNHPNSVISGVYYVDVPEDNMGNIEFYRSDDSEYYLKEKTNTFFGSTKFLYKSQTGVLLLFPSWLKHSVSGNMSNQNRISLSFNYKWD